MNTNIFKHECRTHLSSVVIWSVAISTLLFIFFVFFPVFSDQAAALDQVMNNFPKEFRAAFGIGEMDMTTVLGFYGLIFLYIQLCLAIQAGNYGVGLVSIEESEFTADFLLSKPVSRAQVLTSKLLAVLVSLIATNAVVWVSSFTAIQIFRDGKNYETRTLLLLLISLLIFQLFFLSVGLLISLLVKRVRNVTPYALGLAFGAYILNAFAGMFEDIKLEMLTPFKHLDPNFIILNANLNHPLVLVNLIISIIALMINYWLYLKRDIPMVS